MEVKDSESGYSRSSRSVLVPLVRFERTALNLGGSCSIRSELQGHCAGYARVGIITRPYRRGNLYTNAFTCS